MYIYIITYGIWGLMQEILAVAQSSEGGRGAIEMVMAVASADASRRGRGPFRVLRGRDQERPTCLQ